MTVEQSERSGLAELFDACARDNRAALIGYLPTGYPDVAKSIDAMRALTESGCDIIEVGVPYSDPGMDGPTIATAAEVALRGGVRVRDTLAAVEAISSAGGHAVVMTYWNPVLRYGVDAFARDLAAAGGHGLITPDLIPDEADDWLAASDHLHLDRIFLVAPSSTPERLASTVGASRGFVYAASIMGVTGARDVVSNSAPELVGRVKAVSDIPVGVGLGVRSREQAAQIASYADGVIVGSALVTALTAGLPAMRALTEELAVGVRQQGFRDMTTTVVAYFPSPPQGVWHLGPVPIRAYALFIILGIVAALIIGDRRWVARGGERGVIYDIALWAVPFGLIGGRLYHLATDWRTYFGDGGAGPIAALRIWDGGLGIWGAVALGGVGAWIACRRRDIPLPAFGDAIAPGIILAQAIGRLGNYFNQELFGRETTMPWGLEIFYRRDPAGFVDVHSLDGVSTGQLAMVVQPTFLYELLWNLLVFVLLIYLDRRFTIGHGRLFALYIAGYCVGRFAIELLRDDTATHIAGIRINSFTATFIFIGAVVYLILAPKGREDPATLSGSAAELLEPDSLDEDASEPSPEKPETTEPTPDATAAAPDTPAAVTAVSQPEAEAEAVAEEADAAEVDPPVVEVAADPEPDPAPDESAAADDTTAADETTAEPADPPAAGPDHDG